LDAFLKKCLTICVKYDNFLFVQFYSILVCYQSYSTSPTECIFHYLLIIRASMIIECDRNFNMCSLNLPDFFHSSPICPHDFSFHALSLYILFDMSYSSSRLRANSINCSSISAEKPGSPRCKETLETYWRRQSWI